MAIYIGIDYGEKRVGIALSDENMKLAFPKATFKNDRYLLGNIKDICRNRDVKGIVLGESTDLKGARNSIMDNIDRFKNFLEKELGIEVIYEKEFFTSHQARRFGLNTLVDASAAAIILQAFLDREKN